MEQASRREEGEIHVHLTLPRLDESRNDRAGHKHAVDEADAQQELMRQIAAAGVTTLGAVATIYAPESLTAKERTYAAEPAADNEPDHFPWSDAARWNPHDAAEAQVEDVGLHSEQFDAIFSTEPDEELGTVTELGRYGLIRHHDQPGGCIRIVDHDGRQETWVHLADDGLERRWSRIQGEYERFYVQREAYEQATQETDDAPSGHNPRVWVGSQTDYADGILHGAWFDATTDPEDLVLATKFMLRTGPTPTAEEWAIMDYDGFGAAASELGEYPSFVVVSLVGQGIAEHGPAFGAWASFVGIRDMGALAAFQDHFRGRFDSVEAYVEDFLEQAGDYEHLAALPEHLRLYVTIDTEMMARDWAAELHVAEADGGGVWVFDSTY